MRQNVENDAKSLTCSSLSKPDNAYGINTLKMIELWSKICLVLDSVNDKSGRKHQERERNCT